MRAVKSKQSLLLFLFGRCRGSLGSLGFRHTLLEFIHASGGIDELLLAGIKWVAGVANAYNDDRLGRVRLDDVPTSAPYLRRHILRMNICFHKRPEKITRESQKTRRNSLE